VNDVYELSNMARLRTLVKTEAASWAGANVVTTLAGDFLAPSLLSSIDGGAGMVRVLNAIPVDYVCFGNHESDIGHSKLCHRIEEFRGCWLNSNMPDFDVELPEYHLKPLAPVDGKGELVGHVAFAGFCIGGGKWKATYREGAFGGAAQSMVPVNEAAPSIVQQIRKECPEVLTIIPLTHQDMPEDRELAKSGLFPVIVGGHDHDIIKEKAGECHIVKAGMDGANAAIIDLEWLPGRKSPTVSVVIKPVKDYEPDDALVGSIHKILAPVRELEEATLYECHPDEKLSSVNVKYGENSMARKLASAMRSALGCDGCVLNSGAVRGKHDYDDTISFGHLKAECPYPTPMLVVPMPFSVLRDGVRISRKPWWDIPSGGQPGEGTSALQVDHNITVVDHTPTLIDGGEPDEDQLYHIACDGRVLLKNPVFNEYIKQYPERVPPEDAGRPVLPILVEYFCGLMWEGLIQNSAAVSSKKSMCGPKLDTMFSNFDKDKNGEIDAAELQEALRAHLGEKLSSRIIVEQMITLVDANGDGSISVEELRRGVRKVLHLPTASFGSD
jgi:2',3'-cyclic-nucleotide 2'-phosphodiesterase (5'-nucleotidase family)